MIKEVKKVSFVVPAFNAEQHIDEMIRSIVNQSYQNYELIIVDDGSTDNTVKCVQSFAVSNKKIKLIEKDNSGIVDCLNLGIKHASGDYIARIDADDICFHDRIVNQLRFMEKENLDLCGSGLKQFGGTNRAKFYPQSHDELAVNLATYGRSIPHPTVLAKKKIFDKFIYSPDFPHAEDFELWIKIVFTSNFKVGNCPKALIKYRVHEDQVSQKKKDIQLKSVKEATNKYLLKYCNSLTDEELIYNYRVCKKKELLSLVELNKYRDFYKKLKDRYESDGLDYSFLMRKWENLCLMHTRLGREVFDLYKSFGTDILNKKNKVYLKALLKI